MRIRKRRERATKQHLAVGGGGGGNLLFFSPLVGTYLSE